MTTFRVSLAYMALMTLVWAFLNVTGADGGVFFKNYRVTGQLLVGLLIGFLVFWVAWSWLFYRLKRYRGRCLTERVPAATVPAASNHD